MQTAIHYSYRDRDALMRLWGIDTVTAATDAAITKTTGKTRTLISKLVRQEYNVRAADIKQIVRLLPHSSGKALIWKDGRLALQMFSPTVRMKKVNVTRNGKTHRAKRQHVSVHVRKDIGRQLATGAFFGSGKNSGKRLLFRREDREDNDSRPVIQSGPAIPMMVARVDEEKVGGFIKNEFSTQFDQQMAWRIDKIMKKGGA